MTREQGLAMLGFALLVMLVLFGTLYLTRPDDSVCVERVTQASSKAAAVDGIERATFTEDRERSCR